MLSPGARARDRLAVEERPGRSRLRVSMLLHKSVAHDTRVQREAGALSAAGHEVTVAHLPPPDAAEPAGLPFRLAPATLQRRREDLPRVPRRVLEAARLASRAAGSRPDVVHAHDAAMLLPGLLAARRSGARLVYDSHELATGVAYRGGAWPAVVTAVERLGAPQADTVIAVSEGIAARLEARYRLRSAPIVIRNLPDLPPPGAVPAPDLRRELGIGEAPLVLHQGAVAPGRGCTALLRAIVRLPDAHLLFLGAEGPHADRLDAIARELGVAARTHFRPPVPPQALLSHTAQADIGVSLLEGNCENHRLALPNKLFEYVAAGLPVVVSEPSEAAKLVRKRKIGRCADPADPDSVASALQATLAGREDPVLEQSIAVAADELSWRRESRHLLSVYERLAKTHDGRGAGR